MMRRNDMPIPTRRLARLGRWTLAVLLVSPPVLWATTRGPDAAGYTATDATAYSFIELVGAGGSASALANTDDEVTALTLPFSFQFYGQSYTMVCASTNGLIWFVASAAACVESGTASNLDLTVAGAPGNPPAIMAYWTDLTFETPGAGSLYYQTQGAVGSRKFIVEWSNAYNLAQGLSPNPVTFQVVLYETSNQILFQYKTVNLGSGDPAAQGAQATVGITDANGFTNNREIQWSYDASVLSDGTAMLFAPAGSTPAASYFLVTAPAWTQVATPLNFTVSALDANNNLVSTYAGTVHFTSTDGQAALPAASTLTNGSGTFSATLNTIGNQTVTATDTAASISGMSGTIAVLQYSKCDINQDGVTNVVDVQREINEALGVVTPTHDLNGDGVVNVVDVQIVINAALGLGCTAK
jgi:hypothetical protein